MKLKHLLLATLMGFTSIYANADKISLIADIHVNPGNHS